MTAWVYAGEILADLRAEQLSAAGTIGGVNGDPEPCTLNPVFRDFWLEAAEVAVHGCVARGLVAHLQAQFHPKPWTPHAGETLAELRAEQLSAAGPMGGVNGAMAQLQ